MCVKLPPRDLNPGPYPPHPTSIYICEVTTALRVHGENKILERENKWMMWPLMWLNKSLATINTTFQILDIYIYI